MKRADHVHLKKGQRVRLPNYRLTGVIKEIQVNSTGRIIGVGDIEHSPSGRQSAYGGLVYVPASEIEIAEVAA